MLVSQAAEIHSIDQGINKGRADLALSQPSYRTGLSLPMMARASPKHLIIATRFATTYGTWSRRKITLAQNPRREAPPQQRELDPRHVAHAQQFMIDNSWWDPTGRDADSKRVLDNRPVTGARGFRPHAERLLG